ncbi:MarR family winged helix-turn-helix transcriptional regulator [Cognatishimia sp. MH4019]|uniref:MarR family winged helix-turn-helix transcriptional regulator n=1 Tax=Cognatishimia sp. MH4019 TaxID=2854030 RepID=UPI001CD1DAAB|nr:MarR family transcriptional regulator [Cognatishimia sp. MH4019]
MPDKTTGLYFALFNEIAIIEQLSRAMFEARLPKGLMVSHFSVLNHLVRVGDGATPLKLARAFQQPKTTMTHTLAGLERHGYVRMEPNPKDKRSKQVFITKEGRVFREDAIGLLAPDVARIAAIFPPAQAEALLPGLQALREEMDGLRD